MRNVFNRGNPVNCSGQQISFAFLDISFGLLKKGSCQTGIFRSTEHIPIIQILLRHIIIFFCPNILGNSFFGNVLQNQIRFSAMSGQKIQFYQFGFSLGERFGFGKQTYSFFIVAETSESGIFQIFMFVFQIIFRRGSLAET